MILDNVQTENPPNWTLMRSILSPSLMGEHWFSSAQSVFYKTSLCKTVGMMVCFWKNALIFHPNVPSPHLSKPARGKRIWNHTLRSNGSRYRNQNVKNSESGVHHYHVNAVSWGTDKVRARNCGLSADEGVSTWRVTGGKGVAILSGGGRQEPKAWNFFCQCHPVGCKTVEWLHLKWLF